MKDIQEFKKDLQKLVNFHGVDNYLNMPDYMLADFVAAWFVAIKQVNSDGQDV